MRLALPVVVNHTPFQVLFGSLEVGPPYSWKKGHSSKPVWDRLGITHQGRSEKLERAFSDFGIEESFGQAAMRFEEHYGLSIHKSTVRRVTQRVSSEAEHFIEEKLNEACNAYDISGGLSTLIFRI